MDYYHSGVEPVPALTRALKEYRLLQRRRLNTKMGTQVTIGDAEVTLIDLHSSKTYTGTISIGKMESNYLVQLIYNGNILVVPCGQIVSCSVVKAIVTLQLREDYTHEKCILKFHNEEQAEVFKSKLPHIERPEYHNSPANSDTDFDDSGNEKTEIIEDNSFNSDSLSDESLEQQ